MKKKALLAPCLAIACSAMSTQSCAKEPLNKFFDLPLELLLFLPVSVASLQEESQDWAPSTVTRYDRQRLNRLGVSTIPQLLALVPGVVVQTGLRGNDVIMVRGMADDWNQKVLFLLNDTPYWMPSHGEAPLRGIPFSAIDHIEVIRGRHLRF
jgi:outer membrane cobalamin receptor